jgi:4-alpha-glucanotransferase
MQEYANSKGIDLIGDMPIYVGGQSADVWANQHLFELGADCAPESVSGVPPDAFSATGQLWGSPLYRWEAHDEEGYAWWAQRIGRAGQARLSRTCMHSMHAMLRWTPRCSLHTARAHVQVYNQTRIDHFRAFAGYWAVPATAETAMTGDWRKGPGAALFEAVAARLRDAAPKIMAEDLGVITTDVKALRREIGAPGMVVLQFAWGGGNDNTHLPHNHYANSFVYPGTHDNETAVGWYKDSCTVRAALLRAALPRADPLCVTVHAALPHAAPCVCSRKHA